MLRHYLDFPDLKDDFYNLSLEHFQNGLDPNCLVNKQLYLWSFTNDRLHVNNRTHILTIALTNVFILPENNFELWDYIKKTILELVKDKKIDDEYIKQMAFSSVNQAQPNTSIIEFFIENKLIGVNDLTNLGNSLIMCSIQPKIIPKLIELGCDLDFRVNNTESRFNGMTAYEIAVKSKKRGMTKVLQSYLSEANFNDNFEIKIKQFREEKNTRKQVALFRTALVENNISLVREIGNNQDFYKELIEYYDKQDVNLITATIRAGHGEFLNELMQFDYYQKNKTQLTHVGACYTEVAIYSDKNKLANILYDNGFRNPNGLIEKFKNKDINSKDIVNKLAKDGYGLSPEILLWNYAVDGAKAVYFTKDELQKFFQEYEYYLHFEKLEISPKLHLFDQYNPFQKTYGYRYEVKNNSVNVLCSLLKQQELLDKDSFAKNFAILVSGIGYHDKKIGLKYSSLVLNNFLDKEDDIYGKLSFFGAKEWISQLNKDNLEKLLLTYDDEVKEEKKVKKMKI